jgi:hypothetical protein
VRARRFVDGWPACCPRPLREAGGERRRPTRNAELPRGAGDERRRRPTADERRVAAGPLARAGLPARRHGYRIVMEPLVAILIIAALAAVAVLVLRRRPNRLRGADRPRATPLGRRVSRRHDPMAAAVAEHARATDPADVVVAEQRLRAQARAVAAGMNPGDATVADGAPYVPPAAGPGGHAPSASGGYYAPASAAASPDPDLARDFDPITGERVAGYEDPANDPRLDDPRYDGRLAVDWVDPREDDRVR